MKIQVRFSGLTHAEKLGLDEILPSLELEQSATGIPVAVRRSDRFTLKKVSGGAEITYRKPNEFYRAVSMLADFLRGGEKLVEQTGYTDMLCYMADMSRNAVYNMKTAKEFIRLLALTGYDSLMLYTEDTYEIPEYPFFGYMRGRFSKEELRELDDYADLFGIELIPCIQTLAHLTGALQFPAFRPLVDIDDILDVSDEKTYQFIDAMLHTCRQCFRSRRINIGMDEAHHLGLGKYLNKNGYHPKPEIMLAHLNRVAKMCADYGFEPMMWSDMFFRMEFGGAYYVKEGKLPESVINLVPENVTLIYWDYYTLDRDLFEHMVECHQQFRNPIAFAGGVSKWYGFTPFNAFSVKSAKLQMDVCAERGLRNVIVTAWGDHGAEASQFSILPSMLYYAERAYLKEPGNAWMEARANQCFGIGYSDLLLLDRPNDMGKKYADGSIITPSKYLLYNDLFLGLMDQNMDPDTVAAAFAANAKKLQPMTKHPRWGFVFETLYRLCDLLTVKSDLSVRLRKAYKNGDRDALAAIANGDIPASIEKLDAFLDAFRKQWYRENKPFGFEIQEDRLGGLRQRMTSQKARINAYLAGEIEKIDELEEDTLTVFPTQHGGNPYIRQTVSYESDSPAKLRL